MDSQALIAQVYAAFNRRDVDAALALMTDAVLWPKASEGGSVVGKTEIRAYWTRQWQEFDPQVTPTGITTRDDGKINVNVHQLVKSRSGDLLFDGEVLHVYTLTDGLIARMQLGDGESDAQAAPSPAFARQEA